MPVVSVNAADAATTAGLAGSVRALPPFAPVVVMIHGYRYAPGVPRSDPHRQILSLDPDPARGPILSWPRALGFGSGHEDEGLAIGFGWDARGRLDRVYRRAGDTGQRLAALVSAIAQHGGRPVALIGHSLGARVALQALNHADPGSVGRVVLMAGAEFRDRAAIALDSQAGRRAEILNITSRENDPFDFAMELLLERGRRKAIGQGLADPAANWVDLQIDDRPTIEALDRMGFAVECQPRRLSHWTPCLRRGLFDFYRTALFQPWALPLAALRTRLPGRIEPRWSRLLAQPVRSQPFRA